MNFTRTLLAASALVAAPALAQLTTASVSQTKDETTLIRDVRVFDGERVHEKRSVLIEGNKIADVDFKGAVPVGAKTVEGHGKTLLPGLIDAHTHAFTGLEDALLFGVTTAIDQFSPPALTAAARARTASGYDPGEADIVTAGVLATVPGGHGTQFGGDIPTLTKPEEADAWVAARIAEGSAFIKIVREPGFTGRPMPTLDDATVAALIKAAHKRGKLAVVHVHALADARVAIAAGADGLVHIFDDAPVDPALVAEAKRSGLFISPTYAVIESFHGRGGSAPLADHPAFAGLVPSEALATLRQKISSKRIETSAPIVEGNIAAFHKAGVPILAGSDAPNPGTWMGVSLHRELELLVKSGLTPVEALVAATSAPADAYRIAGRGRIARGTAADLLLVEGDPTRDITATRAIAEVWKDGRAASPLRAARRAQVSAIATATASGKPLALPADGVIARFSAQNWGAAITAPFGRWDVSTDALMGGKSTAVTALSTDGALEITGTIDAGGMARWAGIAFSPGAVLMAPADLSGATAITFVARGTGPGFTVMGFSQTSGQMPAMAPFPVTAEWREVSVPFASFGRFDPKTATMLLIGAVEPGAFRLELKDIKLRAK